jgi:hypothetical protein
MSLEQKLTAIREGARQQIPPAAWTTMSEATDTLRASGIMDGVIEVETTDGATLQWRTGEVFLPADVTGKGHRTRCIGGAVRLLFAPLPEGFAF